MYYFIYKQINITNIGGVSIPTIEGINGGQGSYKEWLLGTTDDFNKLLLIKEFQPRIVPESVWKGFSLIGKSEIIDNSDPLNLTTRPLTAEELQWQKDAINWQLKEDARWLIEIGVGDFLDQVANVDKQNQMITPMIVRVYKLITHMCAALNITIPESIIPASTKLQYDNFSDLYLYKIETGEYKDRVDVEPDPATMIDRLLVNNATLAQILKTEYLDKKV